MYKVSICHIRNRNKNENISGAQVCLNWSKIVTQAFQRHFYHCGMLLPNRTIKFSGVYHLNWCIIVPCVVYVSRTTLNYCQVVNFSDMWNRFHISFSWFLLLSVTWEKTVQIDMFVLQFTDTGMALLIYCYNKTQDFKSQETRTSELAGGNIKSLLLFLVGVDIVVCVWTNAIWKQPLTI